MNTTPLRVLATPEAIGEDVAERILRDIEATRLTGRQFVLGCPTGRTPRPIFAAMARRVTERGQDLGHLVLAMMDEYLVPDAGGRLGYAPATAPWSCHHFAAVEIAAPLGVPDDAVWFPSPDDPAAYDGRLAEAGGIDLFLLASGASDGHVAFNPPGSPRDSRTRIVPLSEDTRRDNLQTFPTFGTLDAVPHHGVGVGIETIVAAKAAIMVVWGAGKRRTLSRMRAADRYDPSWPATLIHECAAGEIIADADAASDGDVTRSS